MATYSCPLRAMLASTPLLVGLRGASPTFPFEDLAAACDWTSKESVLALADQDPNDHQPLFPLEDALGILDQSRDELPEPTQEPSLQRAPAQHCRRVRQASVRVTHPPDTGRQAEWLPASR